jgi:uncharacterized protein with PhoU and TrkA domain
VIGGTILHGTGAVVLVVAGMRMGRAIVRHNLGLMRLVIGVRVKMLRRGHRWMWGEEKDQKQHTAKILKVTMVTLMPQEIKKETRSMKVGIVALVRVMVVVDG